MAVVVADVVGIAPEFRPIPSSEVQNAINDAVLEVNSSIWGILTDVGVKWLAAHKLARSHPELSSEAPEMFKTPGADKAGELGGTRFGLEHYRLLRKLDARVFTAQ